MIATTEQIEKASTKDFKRMVDLVSRFTRAKNALGRMSAKVDKQYLASVERHLGKFTTLQRIATQTEEELERLATAHPEWFPASKRSVVTPSGTVKMHESTSLVVESEEVTLSLLDQKAEKDKDFKASLYIKTQRTPNLNTLSTWTDEELLAVGIKREKKDNFSVVVAKVDMSKAVKDVTGKGKK